jgi:phosphoglycerol transferase MdoB-like AlkP superfamily enzyme
MLAVPAILTGIGPYQDKRVLYSQPLLWEYAQIFDYKTFFLSSHTLKWYKFNEFYKKEKLDVWWNKDNSGLPYFNDLGIKDELTIKKLNRTISKFSNKPFFGVVQLNTTHYPYEVPEKYKKWNNSFSGSYDNAVRYQDAIIGDFFKHLKKEGLIENTIVLFASDHGESLTEHHNIGHVESNYTETISIPLLAYIPDGIISNDEKHQLKKNIHRLTSNIDIAPTIVDLLNLEKETKLKTFQSNFTGYSLLKPIPRERMIISLNNNQVASFNTGLSVCSEDWHYLFRTNLVPNKEEFYFWKKDIGELKDRQKSLSKTKRNIILNHVEKYPVCDKLIGKIRKTN